MSILTIKCPMMRFLNLETPLSVRVTFWGGREVSFKGVKLGSVQQLFARYMKDVNSKVFQNQEERKQSLVVGRSLLYLHGHSITDLEKANTITKIFFMFRELSYCLIFRCFSIKNSDWGLSEAIQAITSSQERFIDSVSKRPISILKRRVTF